jgi:hypothetical protein
MFSDFKKFQLKNLLYFYVSLFAFYFSINLLNNIFRVYAPRLYDSTGMLLFLSLVFAIITSHWVLDDSSEDEKKIRKAGLSSAVILAD